MDVLRLILGGERVVEMKRVLPRRGMIGGDLLRSNAAAFRNGNDHKGVHAGARTEAVIPAAEFAERMDTKLREALTHFLRERSEIGDDHLRLAIKAHPQGFILCGDADWASVEMTLASHNAADGQERGGAEAEFVGAEDRGD